MSKQFILFIVEGEHDKNEINALLHALCPAAIKDKYQPEFLAMRNDITAENTSSESNIVNKLNNEFLKWRNGGIPFQRIKVSDVKMIVHVVDMDGAFIPESGIIEGDYGKPFYTDSTIECGNKSIMIGRNRRKAKNIRKLIETHQIGGVPYKIFFASKDMDHLLFNLPNASPKDKNINSSRFKLLCIQDIAKVRSIIYDKEISPSCDYDESWALIQRGCASLHRHTNLGILIDNDINS